MKIIKTAQYEELSLKAAWIIAAQVIQKPDSVLGLATGSTPLGTYAQLAEWSRRGELDFSRTVTFNLDEYLGLDPSHPQSYRYFMNVHFFSKTNILPHNTHVLDGKAPDIGRECGEFEGKIQSCGGIDLQLLGIGHDGHIGFNEPGETFMGATHCTDLAEATIRANARFFDHIGQVPKQAITMGVGTIMKAEKILLLASGEDKKAILRKALFGPITPAVPASILQLHRNLTVISCQAL